MHGVPSGASDFTSASLRYLRRGFERIWELLGSDSGLHGDLIGLTVYESSRRENEVCLPQDSIARLYHLPLVELHASRRTVT